MSSPDGKCVLGVVQSVRCQTHLVCSLLVFSLTCTYFICVEILRPSQPNGVMSSAVRIPNHTFTGQA